MADAVNKVVNVRPIPTVSEAMAEVPPIIWA